MKYTVDTLEKIIILHRDSNVEYSTKEAFKILDSYGYEVISDDTIERLIREYIQK